MPRLFPILMTLLIFPAVAFSSVIMTGTRIVYPADLKNKTVQLTNPDGSPYLVQLSLDKGKDAEDEKIPFAITPQFLRIEPHRGQSVRLTYLGDRLPNDRETLYFLNFTQLPITGKNSLGENKLVLAITSRVKIFFRPKGIAGSPDQIASHLVFRIVDKKLVVANQSGYYATFRNISGKVKGKNVDLASSVSVPPMSEASWNLPPSVAKLDRLKLIMVNDYGVDVVSDVSL